MTHFNPIDELLSKLVVVMDQSDVEYAGIMKELKTEIFSNQCRQERLGEHLWRLKKREEQLKTEMDRPEVEQSKTKSDLEEDLSDNLCHQEKLREQLQGLEKRLRVVEATASMEELMQDKADEVNWGWYCLRGLIEK